MTFGRLHVKAGILKRDRLSCAAHQVGQVQIILKLEHCCRALDLFL